MIVGFDLDGTLDRPALALLCLTLLEDGHEVHIISGVFDEAGDWQGEEAKHQKLRRIGIPFVAYPSVKMERKAMLHVVHAMPSSFDRDYRLADIGLRKGNICEKFGVQMFFDDSELYCQMLPKMSGNTVTLKVGQ